MGFFSQLLGVAPAPVWTGDVVTSDTIRALLPSTLCGKPTYAEVRDDYVLGLLGRAHDALASAGIRQWEPDATCTLYAMNAVVVACEEYYEAEFHAFNPPPAPAIGFVWFRPDGSTEGHAINVFKTPSGLVFADPQMPDQLRPLSPTEFASIYEALLP